jgi:hypothetical protein
MKIKRIICTAVILLAISCLSIPIAAQDVVHLYSTTASELAPAQWEAKWIWLPGVDHTDKNHVMLARKSFELDKVPSESKLYITADSHYKLWINGRFVTRGPARCDPHHQSYDVLEISKLLKKGINLIAVQVHFHGIMKAYYTDPYPGLLIQLESQEELILTSGKDWKVKYDFGWDSRTDLVSMINANNYSTCYHFQRSIPGWYLPDFDDAGWVNAVYQFGPAGWPSKSPGYVPYAVQRPWTTLLPRDLPQLIEYDRNVSIVYQMLEAPQYSKLGTWDASQRKDYDALHHSNQDVQRPLEKCKVENLEPFLTGKGDLTIIDYYPEEKFTRDAIYHATVIFDFAKVIDGYPYITVNGKAGTIIDINYAPYLIDGVFVPGLLVDNFSDRLTLSGNKDVWENSEIRTMRYMAVTVRSPEPVVFEKIGLRVEEYPFQKHVTIDVPEEPFISTLWTATENTLQGITTDAYTDNYQERRQYVQTSYYASLGNYAVYGDPWLQRRYLVQHAQNQYPNGIMPMWSPWHIYDASRQNPGILEASHLWLMGLHDYYLYTGDEATVRNLLIPAERCAQALNELQFRDNLLYKPPYNYWIDWAKLAQGEQNFIINTLQLLSFRYYAELLHWLEEEALADKWNAEADKMAGSLKRFWSEEYGLFADNLNQGIPDGNFSEHANALAVVCGIASARQSDMIIEKLINNDKRRVMEESVLFHYWITEALCRTGHTKEAVDFMKKRYGHMLKPGENGTLWEYANLYAQDWGERKFNAKIEWQGRSWCTSQGENCFPGITLSHYVLGLRPLSPGMKKLEINSLLTPYEDFSGVLPTPEGLVRVKRTENTLDLTIPDGITGVIRQSSLSSLKKKSITIDGKTTQPALSGDDIFLEKGQHRIELTE